MALDPLDPSFWGPRSELLPDAAEIGPLDKAGVDRLFRREKVRLIVRDRGDRAREIAPDNALQFWQSHARLHTVSPSQVYTSTAGMPGEIAYRASEWYDGETAAVVLLEIIR